MRFPRNTKIFRGPLDAAPFASVLFVLMILLLVQSSLVYTPGVPIRLPETVDLPGTANPKVVVSIDGTGQMYFEHQISEASALKEKLLNAASQSKEPLTLIVQADRAGTAQDIRGYRARKTGWYFVEVAAQRKAAGPYSLRYRKSG